jgi:DNA-binding transcriptional LysR family regulator
VHGHGLVFMPIFHVAAELRARRLVRVLPRWQWPMGVFAVYPPTTRAPSKVRLFVDFMVERLREPPWTTSA